MQELARESAEKTRIAEELARQKVEIYLISEQTFQRYHGLDLASTEPDSADSAAPKVYDPAAPKEYTILGTATLAEFAMKIASKKFLRPNRIRFWFMGNRQNKTIRPEYPLEDYTETFDQITKRQRINNCKVRLYVDVMETEKSIWPSREGADGEILLFLKHYDGSQVGEPMTGFCQIYVRKNDKAIELSARIIKLMKWPSAAQVILFEVYV